MKRGLHYDRDTIRDINSDNGADGNRGVDDADNPDDSLVGQEDGDQSQRCPYKIERWEGDCY